MLETVEKEKKKKNRRRTDITYKIKYENQTKYPMFSIFHPVSWGRMANKRLEG